MSTELSLTVTPALVEDQVYAALERGILTGELPSGSRLRVRDLAASVGTSVMPVRDAIRRLEEAGLAVREPHKGAVVRNLTIEELLEIYAVRTLLETEAARQGAPRVSSADIERMEAALAALQSAVAERRVADALDADEELLRTLYAAGGNRVLVNLIESLWKQSRIYKIMGATVAIDSGDNTLWEPQPDLLAAVRAHDVPRAVRVNKQSLVRAQRRLERRLDAGGSG